MKRRQPLLTRRQLATALGVNVDTVARWAASEDLPVAVRGRGGRASLYDLEGVQAWRSTREAAAKARGGVADALQARAERDAWQARLAEQTYRRRAAELLPADEVELAWTAVRAAIRGRLVRLPREWAMRLAEAVRRGDSVAGVQRQLEEAVRTTLLELSQLDATKATTEVRRAARWGSSSRSRSEAPKSKKKGRKR